jgi:hypothetical protein
MTSRLTWIDNDSQARERSLRILALFREKESRDELGIGGIRDAIADRLFPGTSTIQTRLRYMLFVPWIYTSLEKRQVPTSRFGGEAKQAEIALVHPLLSAEDDYGVFGRLAGGGLKRLPSSIYWAGLGSWGIRRFQSSREDYHLSVDSLYVRRGRRRKTHDGDWIEDDIGQSWHPKLPAPPEGFPSSVDFLLKKNEAQFLRERLIASCPESLLAWLVRDTVCDESVFPWLHHRSADFPDPIKALMGHARRFSDVIQGAALVYNFALAEQAKRELLAEEYQTKISEWAENQQWQDLAEWSLDNFWDNVKGHGHRITPKTEAFVENWVRLALLHREKIGQLKEARSLIRIRETELKKGRSRFTNQAALTQWSGKSGLVPLAYRWGTAKMFIEDLAAGLRGDDA